jgi:hypothetical protein
LRLFTLAIFSVFYLSAALANPNLNFATSALADDVPFNLNFNSGDYGYARDVDLLFRELEKNQLKAGTVENLEKYQSKTTSFSILNSTYARLKQVVSIKDQDSFYTKCIISSKNVNSYKESIADQINISIDKHCRYLFLKRLSALSPDINLSSRDFAYFKDASPFFTTGENQSELVLFFRHFKNNLSVNETLSNILIEKYIEFKLKPSSAILGQLKVSTLFNKFLQNNLNLDDSSNSYFQDEFQRLLKTSQE